MFTIIHKTNKEKSRIYDLRINQNMETYSMENYGDKILKKNRPEFILWHKVTELSKSVKL